MVIDPDYRGEIIVAVHNDSYQIRTVQPNERIAQFILRERFLCDWQEVEELDETSRGEGGFASTGKWFKCNEYYLVAFIFLPKFDFQKFLWYTGLINKKGILIIWKF